MGKTEQIERLRETLGVYLTNINDNDTFSFSNGFDDHDYTGKELKKDPTLVSWLWREKEGFVPVAVLVNGTAGFYNKTPAVKVFTFIPRNKPVRGFLWTGPESLPALKCLLVEVFNFTGKDLYNIELSEVDDNYSQIKFHKRKGGINQFIIRANDYVYAYKNFSEKWELKISSREAFEKKFVHAICA